MATGPEKESKTEHHKISTGFSRNLTLLQITMMGVGMMIGAGVFLDKIAPQLKVPRSLFESKYAISHERLKTILEEAKHYDLVIIGATRDPIFRQRVMGSLPEILAKHCEKPLVMVKAKHTIRSFIKLKFPRHFFPKPKNMILLQ